MMKLNTLFCFVQNFNSVMKTFLLIRQVDLLIRHNCYYCTWYHQFLAFPTEVPVSRAALSRVSVTPIRARGVLLLKYAAQSSVPPLPPLATPAPRVSLLSSVSRSSASFGTTSTGDGLAPSLSLLSSPGMRALLSPSALSFSPSRLAHRTSPSLCSHLFFAYVLCLSSHSS